MLNPPANRISQSQAVTLLVLAIAVCTPTVAMANVGTPLMWATILHLSVGNAFVGILEGALLARVYRVPAARAIGLMILANYVSAWVGVGVACGVVGKSNDLDL